MKKKIFLLTTFLISFIVFSSSVMAVDYNVTKSCLYVYDYGKENVLIAVLDGGKSLEMFYAEKIKNNYSLFAPGNVYSPNKYMSGNVESSKDELLKNINNKGCPKYIYKKETGIISKKKTFSYIYDKKEVTDSEIKDHYRQLDLETTDPIPKKDEDKTQELTCFYPQITGQGALEIKQDTKGNKTVNYKGKNQLLYSFSSKETGTGYWNAMKYFTSCPPCAKYSSNGDITFDLANKDGSCPNKYSGNKSQDKNWIMECEYMVGNKGYEIDTAPLKNIKLYFNETNYKIEYLEGEQRAYTTDFTAKELWEKSVNEDKKQCPPVLYSKVDYNEYLRTFSSDEKFYLEKHGNVEYFNTSTNDNTENKNPVIIPEPTNCEKLLEEDVIEFIDNIMKVIGIAVPILLLVLGITDFFRATFANSEDDTKKARDRFIKRIIAAIIVFIVPFFVKLVLTLANKVWSDINPDTCINE